MKKVPLLFALASTVLASVALSAADATAGTASPFAIMASLAGGLWSGDLPAEKDAPPMSIELRFAWAENKQGMRFDSAFVRGDKHMAYTSGMYGWNAATQKFVIFYSDNSGSLVEGPVTQEGNVLIHDINITYANGKSDVARVRLTKIDDNAFTNTIFLQKNGAWEKFVEVHYARRN